MKDFIFGLLSIPFVFSAMVFYFWITYNAEGNENFLRGTAIGGATLVLLTVVLLSLVRIKP